MHTKDTILTLKVQRDPDPETKEEFPYNRVRVIGQSVVSQSHRGEWTGADAEGIMLEPIHNFGGVIDEPFGKIRALYDVESIPDTAIVVKETLRVIDSATSQAGPTPEEVFAEESPGVAPEPGQVRGRTAPLPEVAAPESLGPLDVVATVPPEPASTPKRRSPKPPAA